MNGYAGKLLRVDLTSKKITQEELSEELTRKYLGGTGLGASVLYGEVPAGVDWSDERNRFILATGPLGGTSIGGSGTISVVTKAPLTNGAVASQANGFFGAFLKFSGFDGIIFQGKAERWVYLYIHDGLAEIRDAGHLSGKDTTETADAIKSELGATYTSMSVACIGPGGENMVKFSTMFVDKGHTASHGGLGAVMGSKKLKAIAVARGAYRPPMADKERLSAIADQFFHNMADHPIARELVYKWGTLNMLTEHTLARDGVVPVKNYTTSFYDIGKEDLMKYWGPYIRSNFQPKPKPCWACRVHHCHEITLTEGAHKGYQGEEPEYEGFAAFGPLIGITDATETIFLSNEVDRLGIDCNETGWTLALAMECYEKGLLTAKDTDGVELRWGNAEGAYRMVRKIANRDGFGDVLAEGAMRAARQIGGDAPNFAIHTMKGNTPRGHDHRSQWPMLLDTCLAQIATDEGHDVLRPRDLGLNIRPSQETNTSAEDSLAWNIGCKGVAQFEDCLGVCRFTTRQDIKLEAEAIAAVTGWNFPVEETILVGRRVVNLFRAFNIRHGHTAEMDAPSPRYGSVPADGPARGKSIMPVWNELRAKYYEGMGWDKETGKPLPDTLKRLGLEYTIAELWGK